MSGIPSGNFDLKHLFNGRHFKEKSSFPCIKNTISVGRPAINFCWTVLMLWWIWASVLFYIHIREPNFHTKTNNILSMNSDSGSVCGAGSGKEGKEIKSVEKDEEGFVALYR